MLELTNMPSKSSSDFKACSEPESMKRSNMSARREVAENMMKSSRFGSTKSRSRVVEMIWESAE